VKTSIVGIEERLILVELTLSDRHGGGPGLKCTRWN